MNELTKQTPGIDEQISRQREVIRHCEGKAGINIEGDKAILTTLRHYKRITEAVMPEEPVIIKIWRGLQNKTVPQQEIIDHIDTLSAVAMKNAGDAELLRKMHELGWASKECPVCGVVAATAIEAEIEKARGG
jgi:hypothetical protein